MLTAASDGGQEDRRHVQSCESGSFIETQTMEAVLLFHRHNNPGCLAKIFYQYLFCPRPQTVNTC